MNTIPKTASCVGWDKVIIRYRETLIKGHADRGQWMESLGSHGGTGSSSPELAFLPLNASEPETVLIRDAKAVFFVESFEGNHDRLDIRFYDGSQHMDKIWARIMFKDGEILEGLVDNTVDLLHKAGFSFIPTDPTTNNKWAYVFKAAIQEFVVLGVRKAPSAIS